MLFHIMIGESIAFYINEYNPFILFSYDCKPVHILYYFGHSWVHNFPNYLLYCSNVSSTSGTCLLLEVTFSIMPISARYFLVKSKHLSESMTHILNPLLWYACTTCVLNFIIVFVILSLTSLVVPKWISCDFIIKSGTLLIAQISIASMTFPCNLGWLTPIAAMKVVNVW